MDPNGARGDGTPGRAHTAATLLPYLIDKEKDVQFLFIIWVPL